MSHFPNFTIHKELQNETKILKKLVLSDTKLDFHPALDSNKLSILTRQKRDYYPKSLSELHRLRKPYWIWIGHYNKNLQPIYRGTTATRWLYNALKIRIEDWPTWYLSPNTHQTPSWDVNPFHYHLANKFEDYYEGPDNPNVEEIIELVQQYGTENAHVLMEEYELTDIEQAFKQMGIAHEIPEK